VVEIHGPVKVHHLWPHSQDAALSSSPAALTSALQQEQMAPIVRECPTARPLHYRRACACESAVACQACSERERVSVLAYSWRRELRRRRRESGRYAGQERCGGGDGRRQLAPVRRCCCRKRSAESAALRGGSVAAGSARMDVER
jgi:hypothetical protein